MSSNMKYLSYIYPIYLKITQRNSIDMYPTSNDINAISSIKNRKQRSLIEIQLSNVDDSQNKIQSPAEGWGQFIIF